MSLDPASAMEFFYRELRAAQDNQNVRLTGETEFYIVHLLSAFLDSRRLFADEQGRVCDEAMASIVSRALSAGSAAERYQLLKTVGDRSLYVSGFFGDSFRRKLIDIDYFISMGETAYSSVSALARETGKSEISTNVFEEMAVKFASLVDLLAEISEGARITSDTDLLRLYERWLATRSPHLVKRLREKGILPVDCDLEPFH